MFLKDAPSSKTKAVVAQMLRIRIFNRRHAILSKEALWHERVRVCIYGPIVMHSPTRMFHDQLTGYVRGRRTIR